MIPLKIKEKNQMSAFLDICHKLRLILWYKTLQDIHRSALKLWDTCMGNCEFTRVSHTVI